MSRSHLFPRALGGPTAPRQGNSGFGAPISIPTATHTASGSATGHRRHSRTTASSVASSARDRHSHTHSRATSHHHSSLHGGHHSGSHHSHPHSSGRDRSESPKPEEELVENMRDQIKCLELELQNQKASALATGVAVPSLSSHSNFHRQDELGSGSDAGGQIGLIRGIRDGGMMEVDQGHLHNNHRSAGQNTSAIIDDARVEKLEQQVEDLQKQIRYEQDKFKTLDEEFSRSKEEWGDRRESMAAEIVNLEKEVEGLKFSVRTNEENNHNLEDELAQAFAKLASAKEEGATAEVHRESLQAQVDRFQSDEEELRETIVDLRKHNHELQLQRESSGALEISTVKQDNQDLLAENRRLEVKIQTLRSEVAQANSHRESVLEEIADLRGDVAELRQKSQIAERQRQALEDDRIEVEEGRQSLEREREELRASMDILSTDVAKWQSKVELTTASLEHERRRNETLLVDIQRLEGELKRHTEESAGHREHWRGIDASNVALRTQLRVATEEISQLRQSLKEWRKRCEDYEVSHREKLTALHKMSKKVNMTEALREIGNQKQEMEAVMQAASKISMTMQGLTNTVLPAMEMEAANTATDMFQFNTMA